MIKSEIKGEMTEIELKGSSFEFVIEFIGLVCALKEKLPGFVLRSAFDTGLDADFRGSDIANKFLDSILKNKEDK